MNTPDGASLASTGIDGLDFLLNGGLQRGKAYLIQGEPGTGKTTLSLQFLLEGARRGERTLYVTLSQTEEELRQIAQSHGWSLDGMQIYELSRQSLAEHLANQQTVLHTADVELNELTAELRTLIKELQPDRFVFDSVGTMRVLAGEARYRYRQEINLLLHLLNRQKSTAFFLDDSPAKKVDIEFQTLAHGVIRLMKWLPAYGEMHRQIEIEKMRGRPFHSGYHSFRLQTGGIQVYPRLQKGNGKELDEWETLKSGVEEFDLLLGGGLEFGTSCLIVGPAGTGKTTIATLYLRAALQNGQKAAIFLFDENTNTFMHRAAGLKMPLRRYCDEGLLHVQHISSGDASPGEFAHSLRSAVDQGAKIVVIDSLTGYFHAMPQADLLLTQMHEMLSYMSWRGVLTMLIVAQHGLMSSETHGPLDVSYMADTVLLVRYFENEGSVRKAISVVKKRHGNHEKTIRELDISSEGIHLGEPLRAFSGVLAGVPRYTGPRTQLMDRLQRPAFPPSDEETKGKEAKEP